MSKLAFAKVNGYIDYQYIRTSCVYKLIRQGKITSKSVALYLLEEKHGKNSSIKGTLEIWLSGPLKHCEVTR
jgi:hypothetical protein